MGTAKSKVNQERRFDSTQKTIKKVSGSCSNRIGKVEIDDSHCDRLIGDRPHKIEQVCNVDVEATISTLYKDIKDLINEITNQSKAGLFTGANSEFLSSVIANQENLLEDNVDIATVNVIEAVEAYSCRSIDLAQMGDVRSKQKIAQLMEIRDRLSETLDQSAKGFDLSQVLLAGAVLGVVILFIIIFIKKP